MHGVGYRGDKYVLEDGGDTDVCLMYFDVGGRELDHLGMKVLLVEVLR
jgi:hypothetical protein